MSKWANETMRKYEKLRKYVRKVSVKIKILNSKYPLISLEMESLWEKEKFEENQSLIGKLPIWNYFISMNSSKNKNFIYFDNKIGQNLFFYQWINFNLNFLI